MKKEIPNSFHHKKVISPNSSIVMLINYPEIIDVIFISDGCSKKHKELTEMAIETLIKSEYKESIKFNIIVIESNQLMYPFQYANSLTVYPKTKFGYNKYLNIGITYSSNKYICFCNNDLIFHKNWANEILTSFKNNPNLLSASPYCSFRHPSINIEKNSGNYYGYTVRREVTGWCIFIKRELLNIVNPFDNKFIFWFADNDYANILQKFNLMHALISNSHVDHLSSRTLNSKPKLNNCF